MKSNMFNWLATTIDSRERKKDAERKRFKRDKEYRKGLKEEELNK